jgi:hypothetical protein
MDQFDAMDFFTHPARFHVWSILGPGSPHQPEPATSHAYSSYLGKIILSYQLLDILLWVFSFPAHPKLISIPPGDLPLISDKLKIVLEHLQILPLTFPDHNLSQTCLGIESPEPAGTNAPHISMAATTFKIAMDNLATSTRHEEAKDHPMFSNIYAVASALRWFTPVRVSEQE